MYEHEIQQQHAAELMRVAAAERLARQAVKARRAARRTARASGQNASEGPVSSLRNRFARAA
ncbi:hypothetical protein AR457_10790 [Streptomyces agglomeratus]|uniref:Uncharacterized protein n=2 Tax=Streptomyces agglomeratus TaxID=285458 RepID=A0A1E5P5S7_9ACTN|nr:hypothetical protein [Streptomyces agglomeratus]OEJ24885.1 hypothetical protein AS594_10735 [Streptomyces agglomeratus]OEJ41104.1 hypothetical protein BGK70_25865 [Streptomyces agglomeratus]OEJ44518.1 hypothetical protein AR457_10790 [Streptomyces agglomeratus]OEJ53646.1 hypothetical protein BGK72_25480 [Streptomyces agglomeratus]OEJ60964.1 hypothetical protein BGM19_26080 [Streptomyces agglomeratus]